MYISSAKMQRVVQGLKRAAPYHRYLSLTMGVVLSLPLMIVPLSDEYPRYAPHNPNQPTNQPTNQSHLI